MQKIVLSLTSYPERIKTVNQVIESLFMQKEQADEIVLWLSIQEFPNKYKDIPEELKCLIGKNKFRIEWVDGNIKSHKKYFYALQNRENITITIDDDMRYSSLMVSTLMDSYRKHPYAISARNVHIITKKNEKISPYLDWESNLTEYIGDERMDLCAIGVNGILYPPGCSQHNWFDLPAIAQNAENQDDLWLKFNEIIDGIPVVYTGLTEEDQMLENLQGNPLYLQNAEGGDNDKSVCKLSDILKVKYKEIYQYWFKHLMTIENFWLIKRDIFTSKMKNIVAKCENKDVYIAGSGKYAHILYYFIKSCNLEKNINAFLVTGNLESKNDENEICIKLIKELDVREKFVVLCGVGNLYRNEFREALRLYEFCEWVDIDLIGIEKILQWEEKLYL